MFPNENASKTLNAKKPKKEDYRNTRFIESWRGKGGEGIAGGLSEEMNSEACKRWTKKNMKSNRRRFAHKP